MELITVACSLAIVLLLWFNTQAFETYFALLKTKKLRAFNEYLKAKKSDTFYLNFVEFLLAKYSYNFFVKLITCQICSVFWLSLIVTLMMYPIYQWFYLMFLTLLAYSILCYFWNKKN
jgi:hypothetical protein